ncbi:MAG: hypothetical protein ABI947_15475 [Chloroflexota bacterium]
MSELTSLMSGSVQQIGQAFLFAYYLPSAVFVICHIFILMPLWNQAFPGLLPTLVLSNATQTVDLPTLVILLLIPLALAILWVGLNTFLIRLYSGNIDFIKNRVLSRAMQSNRKIVEARYTPLRSHREAYQKNLVLLDGPGLTEQERVNTLNSQSEIRAAIIEQYAILDQMPESVALPVTEQLIAPTAFGNALAAIPEYTKTRYGIDVTIFWVRLYTLLQKAAPEHFDRLNTQKTNLDLVLNLSAFSALILLEALILLLTGRTTYGELLILTIVVSLLTTVGFYRASVSAAAALGQLVAVSFDYYRKLILQEFGLPLPTYLEDEFKLWSRLAAFIQRGDPFYFPSAEPNDQNSTPKQ